jgi:hypothetical protein
MNFLFLTEDNVNDIIETYMRNKHTYIQFLETCVDASREIMSNQISLYSADQNIKTFYSEKGLKDRKLRVKFKCVATKNKENTKEEYGDFIETKSKAAADKGFFAGITDSDRCYHIMSLHNVKVNKILERALKNHEDRQYGIVSNRSPPKVETKKKKKTKKPKKMQPIDVTIKFKGEDGNIEEIHVKDKKSKKKGAKVVKAKPQKSISNPSTLDDQNDENVVVEKSSLHEPKSEDNKSKLNQTKTNRYRYK